MSSWVKCDENNCDWKIILEIESVPEWHNKPCPSCSNGVIINDTDMSAWNTLMALKHFSAAIDPDEKMERTSVVIDTAELRCEKEDRAND